MSNPTEMLQAAYMAQDRRIALAAGVSLPEWAMGSALFADISGFTPLSEALARSHGARGGAESLTRLLNALYTRLIAHVEEYGGSVVGFSGDAIACWFGNAETLEALAAESSLGDAPSARSPVHAPCTARCVLLAPMSSAWAARWP